MKGIVSVPTSWVTREDKNRIIRRENVLLFICALAAGILICC
jgi:ribosomal protein L36